MRSEWLVWASLLLNIADHGHSVAGYREAFKVPSPPAYAALLRDVTVNDATLFMRNDQVEAAWAALMPVLEAWNATPIEDFPNYAARTGGPGSADELLRQGGHAWRSIV
jgi:glucose-6-phosphate 1-dehydrogenase